jgi:hypothetical protein
MSGRGKYKSMGVSHREGQDGGGRGGGRGGRGRGNKFRKTLNGNYIKQGGEEANEDSARPQVSQLQARICNRVGWFTVRPLASAALSSGTASWHVFPRGRALNKATLYPPSSIWQAAAAHATDVASWPPGPTPSFPCVDCTMCSCWSSARLISLSQCWVGPCSLRERTDWAGS